MKSICFYFQVHQPFRLKRYRFFEIGKDHCYYDDFANRSVMQKIANKCYLPSNKLMLDLIKEYGFRFKIAYSISGTALDQFEMYAPEVLDSFKLLAETGSVEFLTETYSHSLSALKSKDEFRKQVNKHANKIESLFGKRPKVFRNTELIYSDEISDMIYEMGYNTILSEGAKHILDWKSPNYLYTAALNPRVKLLLKNFSLSDDIAFRFSNHEWCEWPLTADKYVHWLSNLDDKDEIINLFMDYETFGEHQWQETGIFDFLRNLPHYIFAHTEFEFRTPSEVASLHQPISSLSIPSPISWADEERDLTAWLGNDLQDDAFNKLYELERKVACLSDPDICADWERLQTSDHFYYMCTKWFSDGDVHKYFNPYATPYDAFVNYMNVLSDFIIRVDNAMQKPKEISHKDQLFEEKVLEEI